MSTTLQTPPSKVITADRIAAISVSSTMKVMADADKLRREGVDVVDFSAGEPDFPTPDNIKQAAVRALEQNFTKYTPAGGTAEAKQSVVDRHKLEFGTDYKVSECIITVGGKHVLFNYTQALVNPGDEVVIPVPYWVTYKDIVNYAGGKCVFVETDEKEGFNLTAAMIERKLTPRTRIVMINSPSNPSGSVMADAEFEKLYHATSKRGIFLLTDECYSHFLYDGKPYSVASIPNSKPTVLVAGTVSKTYAMTGWRIGYGGAPAELIKAMVKLQSQSTSNPSSIGQAAALEALTGPQDFIVERQRIFQERRDAVVAELNRIPGISCHLPEGAFYVYPSCAGVIGMKTPEGQVISSDSDFVLHLLESQNLAVLQGEAYGLSPFFRISFATSMQTLQEGCRRLRLACEALR
jgi:aspartate aminotransferase